MAKYVNDLGMDAELDYIALCDREVVCSGSANPLTWADVIAWTLATGSPTSASFVKADGDSNGRKLTIAARAGLSITASGSATHVVLALGSTGSTIRLATTCTTQYLTAGGTVDVPAFKIEIADPT
jgi:hypothetical protein